MMRPLYHLAMSAATAALVVMPIPPSAQPLSVPSIACDYDVVGQNMGGAGQPYRGRVSVYPSGDTFLVGWEIGRAVFTGTGLLNGDAFAVAYRDPANANVIGIAVYRLQSDGQLEGTWTVHGGQRVGSERWERTGNCRD